MENIGGIFLVFLNVVTPVFILVVIGYFVGPRLKIDARSLSRTAYFVFIPAFVFNIISEAKIDSELALQMLSFILVAQIAVALLGFLVGKALRQSREITAAFVLIATFGNVGNFGLPLIVFRLGETARTFATVYFVATVFISFVICVGVASWARSGGVTAVFSVFKTPALIALIPALVFNITDVEVPIFLSRLSGLLGQAMIPVMLITLGVQMGEIPKIKINFNVFAASTVRLIGGPVLALLIVPYFGLEGLERSTGILQAAMPAAVLASIIALEYKLLPEFVTTTVLFSTLYSILTLTVILTFI
ncbi:MAG TPA: AEC family transporter [Candidatus Lambdaproteobacteria bacterium]|uniref:AEC family transporter n=1 Tax=SAR324 cluster bacterium TaxID=2024889 RepID=A0A432GIY6_9DELT|nr:MAG: AEC family transporter [SAR324 cluster bacterium]HIB17424.1 AEC family transporter [Candidatus Lambdaproteobacteria bacterium]HIC06374.1 AEC family transporter [Candidatus Lambdaproteobacteria bacterium]HIM43957.1 AEC family transporter [Deltaproteobacteria bacterium]